MATYKDPNTGVTTTQTHVTRPGWRKPKETPTQVAPTFTASGFTGSAAQARISTQQRQYAEERRKAADVSKLQGQKQAGELARSSMIMANQSADRKSRERTSALQARTSQQNITKNRAWQVEDRDILAKGRMAALQAKGRPGAMSEKDRFEMGIESQSSWDMLDDKEKAKYKGGFDEYFSGQMKTFGVGQAADTGQPAPTEQPQATPDPGVGTYRFGSGQTMDANTGLPVQQTAQPQGTSFPIQGRSMYSPPALPEAPQPIPLPQFGGGREVAPDVAATRSDPTRFQQILQNMAQRRQEPVSVGQTEQQKRNALRLGSLGKVGKPSYY